MLGVGCLRRLYRSGFCGISVLSGVSYFVLHLPSSAGRGGEGSGCGQGGSSAAAPAGLLRARCRVSWKKGGCEVEVPWPYPFSVLRSRCLRRVASAAFFMNWASLPRVGGGLAPSSSALRRCQGLLLALRWFSVLRCCAEFSACSSVCSCALFVCVCNLV